MARHSIFSSLRTLFLISKGFWEIKISPSDSDNDFPEFQTLVEQKFNFNYQQLHFSLFLKKVFSYCEGQGSWEEGQKRRRRREVR